MLTTRLGIVPLSPRRVIDTTILCVFPCEIGFECVRSYASTCQSDGRWLAISYSRLINSLMPQDNPTPNITFLIPSFILHGLHFDFGKRKRRKFFLIRKTWFDSKSQSSGFYYTAHSSKLSSTIQLSHVLIRRAGKKRKKKKKKKKKKYGS